MNQREFAEHIGVSQPRVAVMIRQGILKDSVTKKGNSYDIDPVGGEKEYRTKTDPNKRERIHKVKKKKGRKSKKKKPSLNGEKDQMVRTASRAGTLGMDYNTARTLNEQYKAAMIKLEYETRVGKHILASEVEKVGFAAGQTVKEGLKAIPERIAPILAAETDTFRVKELLMTEINLVLEELSRALRFD